MASVLKDIIDGWRALHPTTQLFCIAALVLFVLAALWGEVRRHKASGANKR